MRSQKEQKLWATQLRWTLKSHCVSCIPGFNSFESGVGFNQLGSGLGGSRSSPSSLLPYAHYQQTFHWCLPFTPAAHPLLLTWLKHYGCNGIYQYWHVTGNTDYKNTMWFHYCFSEMIMWADHCYCTLQKHHFTSIIFFSETIIPGILWVRTKNSEWLTQENDALRNDASDIIIHCLYGRCTWTRKNKQYLCKYNKQRTMDTGFKVLTLF
jgi:hypothetical protein